MVPARPLQSQHVTVGGMASDKPSTATAQDRPAACEDRTVEPLERVPRQPRNKRGDEEEGDNLLDGLVRRFDHRSGSASGSKAEGSIKPDMNQVRKPLPSSMQRARRAAPHLMYMQGPCEQPHGIDQKRPTAPRADIYNQWMAASQTTHPLKHPKPTQLINLSSPS